MSRADTPLPGALGDSDEARRFRIAAEVFERARLLDPESRESALLDLCAGDPELLIEVRSLLAHHEAAEDTLDRSVVRPAAGATIGRYRIDGTLGEGGMGTVYRATQREPVRREVALKVIKLGMDTRQVVRRFEAERQALARLEHPNVARVLDGGATPDGRPYFVMELVRGATITDHADRKRLGWRDRVRLVREVCNAVHHAHQRGILHRDLKPSNLLVMEVDGVAIPKVIDFGVAKALFASPGATEHSETGRSELRTDAGHVVGTPDYMSPEQAEGLDVDTRTDVYALGVVLYELMAGTTPLRARTTQRRTPGPAEMRRRLLEEDPPRPSSAIDEHRAEQRGSSAAGLRRAIRGDLDWIILKAIARDPARRYASVAALAEDLDRLLADEPISARPPSTAYLLRKFARRHTLALAGTAFVAAALIVGTAVSLYGLRIARQERDSARTAEREQSRLAGALADQLFASDVERGRQAAQQGNWAEARVLLWHAIESDPESPHARWAMREMVWGQGCLATWRFDDRAMTVRFLADNRHLVTAARGSPPVILDIETGEAQLVSDVPLSAWEIDVSHDERWLVTADTCGSVVRWDLRNRGAPQPLVECGEALACVRCDPWAPVAYAGGIDGILWRVPLDGGHPAPISLGERVKRIDIAPDGRVAAGREDGSVTIVAPDGSGEVRLEAQDRPIQSLAFGQGGRLIAAGSTGPSITVHDTLTGELLHRLSPRVGTFRDLRFGPDDRTLLVLGWWAALEYSLVDHTMRTVVPVPGWRLDVSPNGALVALASESLNVVSVWDTSEDGAAHRGVAPPRAIARPNPGTGEPFLAAGGGGLLGLDGRGRREWIDTTIRAGTTRLSRDGSLIASVGSARRLRVHALPERRLVTDRIIDQVRADSSTIAFDNGRRCAFARTDNSVWILDLQDGSECLALPPVDRETLAVALSPDGEWLAVTQRKGVTTYVRLSDGATIEELSTTTGFWMEFTKDSSRCLTGTWSGELLVRDMVTGITRTLAGHSARVTEVAVHPTDPDLAVSASEDGTLRVWHLGLGREVAQLRPFGDGVPVAAVGFIADGTEIAAVGHEGELVSYSTLVADRIIRQTRTGPGAIPGEE